MDIVIGYRDVDVDYVCDKMYYHCQDIDKKLRKVDILTQKKHTDYHDRLIAQRGFTYDEYLWLFDGALDENQYHNYPVFNFLKIVTDVQRRYFTARYEASKEDYIRLLKSIHFQTIETFFRRIAAHVPASDLNAHCYISGRTRSGKSTVMQSMFRLLQEKGHSLVLIDPHGDLAKSVKRSSLNSNHENVIFISPTFKKGYKCVINPFDIKERNEQYIITLASRLVSVFADVSDSKMTHNMKTPLTNIISTLLRKKGSHIKEIRYFFDKDKRDEYIQLGKQSPHESQREFFSSGQLDNVDKVTARAIQRKINSFLNIPAFYNMVTGKSTIDLEDAMNSGKTIIIDLSIGDLDEEGIDVMGKFFLSLILFYAFKRPIGKRPSTYVFIDEFQNFVTNEIGKILDQAAKYGLHLILANQYIMQVSSLDVKNSVKVNTNVKLFGMNVHEHFEFFAKTLGKKVEELTQIPKYHFLLQNGTKVTNPVKSSNTVNAPQYLLTRQEEKELDKYLLEKYYVPIDSNGQKESELKPKFGR